MNVIKRNGSAVEFDITKIENAIEKAFVAVNRKPQEAVIQPDLQQVFFLVPHFAPFHRDFFIMIDYISQSINCQ